MKPIAITAMLVFFTLTATAVSATEAPVSQATSDCLECHASVHPGIVSEWRKSRHAQITPAAAMAVAGLARKVSSTSVPEELQKRVVGCAECHTLNPGEHADTFEHNGYQVHVVVTPNDCRICHAQEAEQFTKNLMAHAYNNLAGNAVFQKLEISILGKTRRQDGSIAFDPPDAATRAEACYYCHGTKMEVTGSETRETELAGELKFPVIAGWPNQGVGRINPDGSMGACSACHTRHSFAIEMAREPYTCEECHVGPDVPAFKVYEASKHGNIFSTMHASWDFKSVPWTIGKDLTAPTCAACHISLLVNTDGDVVVERTHQINNRLPWRIFGLIYAHPHPKNPDTTIIRNKDGQQLPTDFEGGWASDYLIDKEQMDQRRKTLQAVCLNCHDTSWVRGQWERLENTIRQTNADTLTATAIMAEIWKNGWADRKPNPFDEAIEKKWCNVWLFYANTIRFASAMGCGGDYGVFAGGRYQMIQSIVELDDWLQVRQQAAAGKGKQ